MGKDERGHLEGPEEMAVHQTLPSQRGLQVALQLAQERLLNILPQKLRICVNGIELCEQSITAALNELRLTVNVAEKVTFVEIYSELRIRLLFMDVEAFPDGPMEQTQRVNLSDGRTPQGYLEIHWLVARLGSHI